MQNEFFTTMCGSNHFACKIVFIDLCCTGYFVRSLFVFFFISLFFFDCLVCCIALYWKAEPLFLSRKSSVSVTFAAVCFSGLFKGCNAKKKEKNSCLSQALSGSAGGGTVMGGLTGRKTACGSTSPSVSALYNAM